MTKPEFYCEICHAPMEFVENLSSVKKINTTYRRRRFKCTICDFREMICGDGTRDKRIDYRLMESRDINDIIKDEETY